MSLTASMWTGVSGLINHGSKMNIIGNNIANTNTIGFKGQRMDFEDFIYQDVYSAQGIAQSGRGVSVGAIMGDFSQGSYESTMNGTDLAIGGSGYFKVSPPGSDTDYFTRAGNFNFDHEGYLQDPHGYALQGWKIDNTEAPQVGSGGLASSINNASQIRGIGVPVDIRLDTWTVEPKQTTSVGVNGNLAPSGGQVGDKAYDSTNPFASLFNIWDGTQPPLNNNTPSIPQKAYSHQTTIIVYDEAGGKQELTVYFDQVSDDSIDGGEDKYWEYIVTMDPAQDKRKVAHTDAAGNTNIIDMKETKNAGLLMSGTLTFDSGGRLKNQSAYTVMGDKKPDIDPVTGDHNPLDPNFYEDPANPGEFLPKMGNDLDDTSNSWFPAEVSSTGYPMFVANFTGVANAHTAGSPEGDRFFVEFDLGLKMTDLENPWVNPGKSLGSLSILGKTLDEFDGKLVTTPAPGEMDAVKNPYPDPDPAYLYNNPTSVYQIAYENALIGAATPPTDAEITAAIAAGDAATEARLAVIWNTGSTTPGGVWTQGSIADITDAITLQDWPYMPAKEFLTITAGVLSLNDKGKAEYFKMLTAPTTSGAPLVGTDTMPTLDFDHKRTMMGVKAEVDDLSVMSGTPIREAGALTSYGTSATIGMTQNGYGYGDLTNYQIDGDGVLSGIYSNGVTLPLYQVALYDFVADQGLRRDGGNLFSETRDSGSAKLGKPNEGGMGKINSHNLEQSNVDLSREFVLMITTQRGFEANSKIVTSVDGMLETVINMKR